MLISKIDVTRADSGAKLPKIPVQVGSHTTNQKLLFSRIEEVVSYWDVAKTLYLM